MAQARGASARARAGAGGVAPMRLPEVAELGREGAAASQVAGSSCTKPGALSDTIGWLMRHDLVQLNQSRGEAPPPSPFKSHKGSIMVMAKSR